MPSSPTPAFPGRDDFLGRVDRFVTTSRVYDPRAPYAQNEVRRRLHPGARLTNGWCKEWADFYGRNWTKLVISDVFRSRSGHGDRIFWTCWTSARPRRGFLAMARRLGPRRAANEVNDCGGHAERHAVAIYRSHLAFPARDRRIVQHCGRIARNIATARRLW